MKLLSNCDCQHNHLVIREHDVGDKFPCVIIASFIINDLLNLMFLFLLLTRCYDCPIVLLFSKKCIRLVGGYKSSLPYFMFLHVHHISMKVLLRK